MIKEIKTIRDVTNFFNQLVGKEKLSFHPDENFEDYVNLKTDERSYTDDEAHERNTLMESCFVVCNQKNVDIYDVAIQSLNFNK